MDRSGDLGSESFPSMGGSHAPDEQTLQFYESLLQAQSDLGEGIATLDLESQRFLYVNDAFCRITGYDRRELLAMPSFFALVAIEDVPRLVDDLQARLTGSRVPTFYEVALVHKDGTRVDIEVAQEPMGSPDTMNIMCLVRDISKQKRASEEQRRAQERYRAIVEDSVFGIFQTAADGRILAVNPAAARIIGYHSPSELMREVTNIRDLYVDPTQRDAFVALMSQYGQVRDFTYRLRRNNGDIAWVSVTARAVKDQTGNVYAFEGMVADVTEKELASAAARVFSSELDPNRALHALAEVVKEVLPFAQMTLTTIEGERCRRLVSVGEYTAALPEGEWIPLEGNPQQVVLSTQQALVVEDLGRFGVDKPLKALGVRSYAILPLVDEGGIFATLNVSFLDEHIPQNTADLLSTIAVSIAQGVKNVLTFEDRLATLRRLEELDGMKNDLVAMVAHDLRSPLSAMMGFADTMVTKYDELPDDLKKNLLERISKSSRRLARLIEDLLTVAAIEAGTFSVAREPFDVVDVVHKVCAESLSQSDSVRVHVRCPSDMPLALGDRQRTWQIVANLVTNALKFSEEDAPVEVVIGTGDDVIALEVRDHGIGVASSEIAHIFEKYARATNQQGIKAQGLGLGLHTCKLLVEAQGGSIGAESTPGIGSSFHFTLPAAQSA